MKQVFKVKIHAALAIFVPAYFVYVLLMFLFKEANIRGFISVIVMGIILVIWTFGWRPYRYEIERRELTIKRRFFKDKTYSIVDFELITDPEPTLRNFFKRSDAMFIYYDNGNEKIMVYPAERVNFVGAILRANKRITCNVRAYNDTHKTSKKRRKRDRRNAKKLGIPEDEM